MSYIKHNWQFYKKVNLDELKKEELLDLIKNAIEIEPTIIERRNTIYKDRYWDWYKPSVTWLGWNGLTSNGSNLTWDTLNLDFNNYSQDQLITLCSSL